MNSDQIIDLLNQLAEKLQGPAKYVFDLAVKQTLIDGVTSMLVSVMIVAAVTIAWVIWYKIALPAMRSEQEYNKDHQYPYNRDSAQFGASMAAGLLLVVTCFLAIVAATSLLHAINYLLNPEYWTLIKLVDLVK